MFYKETIADIAIAIKENKKISDFFQRGFIAERVNGVIVAINPKDFERQPVKILQADNIGNYFYIIYDNSNIQILESISSNACSRNFYASIICSLVFYANNARLEALLSVFLHELKKVDAITITGINTNGESILANEFEHLSKIPANITIAAIEFTIDLEIPEYTNELCLTLTNLCNNC